MSFLSQAQRHVSDVGIVVAGLVEHCLPGGFAGHAMQRDQRLESHLGSLGAQRLLDHPARGRVAGIQKPYSHLTVVVREREEQL